MGPFGVVGAELSAIVESCRRRDLGVRSLGYSGGGSSSMVELSWPIMLATGRRTEGRILSQSYE